VDPNQVLLLSDLAWENKIPLIKVASCGFFGSVRTQINEVASKHAPLPTAAPTATQADHPTISTAVVETHPESLIDLRVHAPFPSLVEYAQSFDFGAMNSQQHGHIPAVVILVQALEAWRASVSPIKPGLCAV